MQQPDGKGQITIGSPANITLNTLNGNQFFTLDYQGKQAFSKTILQQNYKMESKNRQKYCIKNVNFIIKNPVKSAQFSRSTQNSFHPFSRIKRVDQIIKQKRKINDSLNQAQTQRVVMQFHKPIKKQKFITIQEVKYRSFLMQPIKRNQNPKRQIKPLNNFSQNYKNRRKLADRSFKKSPRNHSPVGSQEREKIRQRNWSPLDTKFMINHFQNKSIEGNKIKYEVSERNKRRYN